MQRSTIQKLEEMYNEFPGMRAQGVPQSEIDEVVSELGIPFSADYQEFLRLYGGGQIGSKSVAGLKRWEFAANTVWSITELTDRYRKQQYPGTERWAVFSDDGFGNPISFDERGRIWISDHNSYEFVCIEESFEDWILRWALSVAPHRAEYIAQEKWPDEIIHKLRNRTR